MVFIGNLASYRKLSPRKQVLLLALGVVLTATIIGVIGVFAATGTITTSNIQVHVILKPDNVDLENVAISLRGIDGGTCTPSSQLTATRINVIRPKNQIGGLAQFSCTNGGSRKKYVVESAVRAGYVVSPITPHPISTGKFTAFAGKKGTKRSTLLSVYMNVEGASSRLVPPAPPGAQVNHNNIQVSELTYHAHLFGHYPAGSAPEPGWILNFPRGYYLGSVFPGWSTDLVPRNAAGQATPDGQPGYMFGMIWRTDGSPWGCGWLEPGTVSNPDGAVTRNNPCVNNFMAPGKQSSAQDNRDMFGQNFNCNPTDSLCNGPISIDASGLNLSCSDKTFYKNYFSDSTFATGTPQDAVGTLDFSHNDQLRFRYTTKDGLMAVVAAPDTTADGYGWGFIHQDCIKGSPFFPAGSDHVHTVWTDTGPVLRP